MEGTIQSIVWQGAQGMLVDIECHLSNNLPTIVVVGSANRAVAEAKERIRGAFATSRIVLPRKRITLNLAPADVPKTDSGFDLAMAVAILYASQQTSLQQVKHSVFIGELGLDGSTRAVRGIIGKLLTGRDQGVITFYIPEANVSQARLIPGIKIVPVTNLLQLYKYLSGAAPYTPLDTGRGGSIKKINTSVTAVRLSEITGQAQAKRAIEIAAAGGHNIFLDGPPGTGKSMLAKALPGLLPPPNREEILEVTQLNSLASHAYERLITARPFRAPHHSASLTAITGGGAQLRPGEISLAHRGVLLFDELPEFNRETLETLRQPLEDRTIRVIRAHGTAEYPADFIFAATANPCPCGYLGSERKCICSQAQISNYRNRLSGPILDRMDLYSNVHEVDHNQLLASPAPISKDEDTVALVATARARQAKRFGTTSKLNAHMANAEIKQKIKLEPASLAVLNLAAQNLQLSARGYMRTIRVAQTIADLDDSNIITGSHLAEALRYRPNLNIIRKAAIRDELTAVDL